MLSSWSYILISTYDIELNLSCLKEQFLELMSIIKFEMRKNLFENAFFISSKMFSPKIILSLMATRTAIIERFMRENKRGMIMKSSKI